MRQTLRQLSCALPLLLSPTLFLGLHAQQIEIEPAVSASTIFYDSDLSDDQIENNRVYRLTPSVSATYTGNRFNGSLQAEHIQLRREKSEESKSNNFTNFRYQANFEAIDNLLSLSFNGSLRNQANGNRGTFIADPILNSNNLFKVRTNTAAINFAIPNPKWFGFDWQLSYSDAEAEEQADGVFNLDNENTSLRSSFYQGDKVRTFSWQIDTQISDTQRQNLQDAKQRQVTARFGTRLSSGLELIAVANSLEYELSTFTFSGTQTDPDTLSYGAGISLLGKANNTFDITYNKLERSEGTENFFGVNTQWQFSERTNASFRYDKRFFGDAFAFSLSQTLKNFRVVANYSEDVNTQLRFQGGTGNLGVLVCPESSFELANCFAPASLNFEPDVGQTFVNFVTNDFQITEEVQLRKAGSISIGYEKRRLTTTLTLRHDDTQFLESSQRNKSKGIALQSNYAIGVRTNINFSASFDERQFSQFDSIDENTNLSLGLTHRLSRTMDLSVDYRYLDRDATQGLIAGRDNRVTLTLSYSPRRGEN